MFADVMSWLNSPLCRSYTAAGPGATNRDRHACSGYYVYTTNNLYFGCSTTSYSCYFQGYVSLGSSYTTYYRAMTAQLMRSYFP